MKLCFFSLNRLAFVGGAEKYILQVSRELKRQGHEVFYLGDCRPLLAINIIAGLFSKVSSAVSTLQDLVKLPALPSFPVDSINYLTPVSLSLKAFVPFSSRREKTTYLLRSCQSVLVKNELLDMFVFSFLTMFNREIKPSLMVFSSFLYPSDSWRGKLHNFFYSSFLYRLLLKRYARIIVSNSADVSILKSNYKISADAISLVPYGLSPEEFKEIGLYHEDKDKFKILFVGRLEEQKGIDILIDVIRRLLAGELGEGLRFTIIGDGPWRDLVVQLSHEFPQVRYLGEIPHAQVIQEYYCHDLLLVPSRWETFSYVTLEAQFCGLPVIAFDIPGPQDIIEKGKTGTLVPAGEIFSFLEAVEDYVKIGFGATQRNYIIQHSQEFFSLGKTSAALLKL